MNTRTRTVSTRLDAETVRQLDRIAREERRSRNGQIDFYIRAGLAARADSAERRRLRDPEGETG